MKQKHITLFLLLLFSTALQAQVSMERTALAASGDEYINGSLHLDWTAGETVTETYTQAGLEATQGFQQGNLLINRVSQAELPYPVTVFPNPTDAVAYILVETTEPLHATLISLDGKKLMEISIDNNANPTAVSLHQLPAATYLLQIADKDGRMTTFKIQKI